MAVEARRSEVEAEIETNVTSTATAEEAAAVLFVSPGPILTTPIFEPAVLVEDKLLDVILADG